jgi:hypothetical protein
MSNQVSSSLAQQIANIEKAFPFAPKGAAMQSKPSPAQAQATPPGSHHTTAICDFDYYVTNYGLPIAIIHNGRKRVAKTISATDLETYVKAFALYFDCNGKLTLEDMKKVARAYGVSSTQGRINAVKTWLIKNGLLKVTYIDRGRIKKPWGKIKSFNLPN